MLVHRDDVDEFSRILDTQKRKSFYLGAILGSLLTAAILTFVQLIN